jgi:hypothetical protein
MGVRKNAGGTRVDIGCFVAKTKAYDRHVLIPSANQGSEMLLVPAESGEGDKHNPVIIEDRFGVPFPGWFQLRKVMQKPAVKSLIDRQR